MEKTTFGLLVTTRGFFNPALALEGRKRLIDKLEAMGHGVVALGLEDTANGAVENFEDAEKCAKLFKAHRDEIGGIILSAPNFGDEVSTVSAVHMAGLNVPLLVHAFDDRIDQMGLESRRDSFCGKLSICANLYQYGMKFTNTRLHTCDVDDDSFAKDIAYFNGVCNVVRRIRGSRIAQIGTRPAAFQTVRFSEKLLQKSGVSVIPVDLSEIIGAASAMKKDGQVLEKISEIRKYGTVPAAIPETSLERSAKLTLAIEKFMRDNKCDAGAVQCWDSIELNYGCSPCLTMSMINENGRAMACETDITGALSMLALSSASGNPSGYMDWNNNYGGDRDKCVMIHCSNYPKSFFGCDFEISNLDIMGAAVGYDKCFGACKAKVRGGDVTFTKISTDDSAGKIKCYVGEGMFTDDPLETKGAPAVAKVPNLQRLMDYLCKHGFEHHVAMNKSLVADIVKEAFENYLGWEVYRHS